MQEVIERSTCRISGELLTPLFTLGDLYLSDFVSGETEVPKVPLELCLAPGSGLVQLRHTAPFEAMYKKYWYKSGTNESMVEELKEIATSVSKLMRLKKNDPWVDVGCNDGTLFKFLDPEIFRVGFDPNDFSEESKQHADRIVNDYFTSKAYGPFPRAKVITAIAMFYDLENPHAFMEDIKKVLDNDGLFVIQMSYLPLMLKQLAFDNICHEHLEYYSLTSLKYLLDWHDMQIVDCQLNDVNGGSFRTYVRKNKAAPETFASAPYRDVAALRVQSILEYEKTLKLDEPQTYLDFFLDAGVLRDETMDFLYKVKSEGKKIWAYGASTKGNTLLQWWGINNALIDGIAERQPQKYGLRTVGTNIPIYSDEEMREAKPDYLLVLPWHFIDSFVRREKEFLERGGKFIVPCPKFQVI